MQCRDAQFYLRLRRHAADELGPDVAASLDAHLTGCPACAADARAVLSFDRAVANAMVSVPVPTGLRDRLLTTAAGKQGAILRRKVYQGGGLVVAALLLLGIGFGVFTQTRPKVDAQALLEANDEQLSASKESTRRWLAAQKLPPDLPLPFDYDLLISRDLVDVHGRNVPVLVFRSPEGSGFAKVFLFPHDGRLDLKGLQDAQASLTRATVWVGEREFRGVTYVFVHTGGPDDPQNPRSGLKQFFVNGNAGPAL